MHPPAADATWTGDARLADAAPGPVDASPDVAPPRADGSPADAAAVPDVAHADALVCLPAPEVCNGFDEDCDGIADNHEAALPGACTLPFPEAIVDWVPLAAGEFTMGRDADDGGRSAPEHRVGLPAFDIARSETTNAQYLACVAAGVCPEPHWDDGACSVARDGVRGPALLPLERRAAELPVACVTWDEARLFAAWVGGRLPSEAEWEYAARGEGRDVPYPWGDAPEDCTRMNYSVCQVRAPLPACSLPLGNTPQGVCDLSGNMTELMEDWFHHGYVGAPLDGSVWRLPPGSHPVHRGGSFVSGRRLSVWSRSAGPPDVPFDNIGFRVVRSSPTPRCAGDSSCVDGVEQCHPRAPQCVPRSCGDGIGDAGEACDDGNADPCDGCAGCQRRRHLALDAARRGFVEITDSAAFRLVDTPFTVELFVRLDGPDDRVDVDRRGNPNLGWRLTINGAGIGGGAFSGDSIGGPVEIAGTGWRHVAWTYDGTTSRVFLDGVLVESHAPMAWIRAVDTPIHLSALRDGAGAVTTYTTGRVDELRISDVARYVEPFARPGRLAVDANALGLWHFDLDEGGAASGLATDATGRELAALLHDADLLGGDGPEGACP
jgi:formylglycine-generating enzyme required for sulfatase activity